MDIHAENGKQLIEIIGTRGIKPIFNIPNYQRPYSWKTEHCEQLLEDIKENQKGYFLGSLVLVQNGNTKAGDTTILFDTIDGQQRLTTLSLLYAALYEFLENKPNFKGSRTAIDLKDALIIEDGNMLHLKLDDDRYGEDFEYLIHKVIKSEGWENKKEPSGYKKRRIYKNFNYFREKLAKYTEQQAKELLSQVNSTVFVQIITYDITDAFIIFQSINDTGLNLSLVDIIKIEFIKNDKNQEKWKNLLEKLSDESDENIELQTRFFRHFYNAFIHKYELQGYNKATKSNITKIFKELCKKNSSELLTELVGAADIYGSLNYPSLDQDYKFSFCAQELLDLRHVQAKPAYLFLLYLFSSFPTEHDLLKDCVNLLVKYFIRRNFTNTPATNTLDKIFMDLITKCEEIKKQGKKLTIQEITNFLLANEYSSINDFVLSLQGDIYTDYPEATRFVLCAVEQAHFTQETRIDLWERKNNKYTFTIEHVLPEAENMHPEWIKMIAKGDKHKATVIQEKFLHKLGNLTLSVYNSNLGKLPLDQKQNKKDENGNPIGYNNGRYLNKILKDIPEWNENTINERTERLIKEILKLFHFSGETHKYLN